MKNTSVTKELSEFVFNVHIQNFPAQLIGGCKRCLLDWLGVTLGAIKQQPVTILMDFMREVSGKKQASIIGCGMKTDILNAALINGTMAHTLDYDDAHMNTRNHPSAPLIPALLSVSEYEKLSGSEFVTAFILGFEVSTRIGLALGKAYYDLGWHATPILGRFGAAAGVGKLLGLNAKSLNNALGLAATQAGGTRRAFGTMAKAFHAGKAAMDGILAAMLAQRGFTAPEDILDEDSGFLGMFSPEFDVSEITNRLGERYHLLDVSLKPYAACLAIHPAIDGLISIRNEHRVKVGSIDHIDLEVAPICLALGANADPKDGLEGKFSISYCAALAVLEGSARQSLFNDERVHEPRIRELMEKTRIVQNESLEESEAVVKVLSKDGAQYTKKVSAPKGHPKNPLNCHEIIEKFKDLSSSLLSDDVVQALISMIQDLEKLENIAKLLDLLRRASNLHFS